MLDSKTLNIYTIVNSRLDLLELQIFSFASFIRTPINITIVDNSTDNNLHQQFKEFAEKNQCNYIAFGSTNSAGAGYRHADCLNYVWQNHIIKDKTNYCMLCDSDIFAIKSFKVSDILENKYIIAAPLQHREKIYFWLGPTVALFDMPNVPTPEAIKWDAGHYVNGIGLDTGGGSYNYLESIPNIKQFVKNLKATHHLKKSNDNLHCLPDKYQTTYKESYSLEFFSNYFLHYARGSNWDHASHEYHKEKTLYVSSLLDDLVLNIVDAKEHNFLIENEYYGKWKYSDG
jgi:hypothetical protein